MTKEIYKRKCFCLYEGLLENPFLRKGGGSQKNNM